MVTEDELLQAGAERDAEQVRELPSLDAITTARLNRPPPSGFVFSVEPAGVAVQERGGCGQLRVRG
ncbi:hypothetical protein [Nonomuraea sp. NPDC049684]|uniref:hypothetical protein n=1 Tax=Nonomuraea sp. NPDC049684 TaxID=3364356 RepID=UPI00379A516F